MQMFVVRFGSNIREKQLVDAPKVRLGSTAVGRQQRNVLWCPPFHLDTLWVATWCVTRSSKNHLGTSMGSHGWLGLTASNKYDRHKLAHNTQSNV